MSKDYLEFRTFDDQAFIMPSEIFGYEVFPGNFGAPPTDFTLRRGYKQDGQTEVEFTLSPRQFDVAFWRAPACDRQTYWANRLALLEFFRPNRNGPMRFTVIQPDGTKRALTVRADPGPVYAAQQDNNWNIRETISFTAFDPIWYGPDATALVLTGSNPTDLIFPITFPIKFGASGLLFATSITYVGTWKSYPTIILTGPYTTATITNVTTGISVFMTFPIAAGETRTLDLTPGAQTIVDGSGNDAFDELGPLSNLINFNLRPDPEVSGGVNVINVTLNGGLLGTSHVTFSYRERYFGI